MQDVNQPLFLCEIQTQQVLFKEGNYTSEFNRPLTHMVGEFSHSGMHSLFSKVYFSM